MAVRSVLLMNADDRSVPHLVASHFPSNQIQTQGQMVSSHWRMLMYHRWGGVGGTEHEVKMCVCECECVRVREERCACLRQACEKRCAYMCVSVSV